MAGFIELIAKIKPKNNGKYPLVDDVDVEMEDGSRLSEAIKKPRIPDGGTEGQILAKKSNTNGDAEWVDPLKTEDIDKKLESKLDKNLGSENSDKVLTTDAKGNIITQNKEDFEGSGGTTDYNSLTNKPSINGVELKGNKTSGDLKMYTQEEVDDLLYDKMDKPYKPITITDGITIEDCLDGRFKINKILGNTFQAEETDIVPTPQRPIPINSRKTTITKINPNIFDFEKENDTSNIPDSGTYRSIGQHQLKPNTKYVFSWSEANVPGKGTLSFQIQDDKGTVLVSPFTYFNLQADEKKEAGKEVEFTTNSSGIVKFAYNCVVGTSSTTETYQQYWYTKILKDISLKEDVEYEPEYVELRSLKETSNLFDKNIMAFTSGTLNSDGTVGTNASYAVSGFVPVRPSTQYTIKIIDGFRGSTKVYYDINKQVISNEAITTFTTPSNCYFVRWQTATTDTRVLTEEDIQKINDEMMMVKGDSLPSSYVAPTVRDYKIVDHTTQTSKIVRNIGVANLTNLTWTYGDRDLNHIRCYAVPPTSLKFVKQYCYCNVFECNYSDKYDYSKEAIYLGNNMGGKIISIMANADIFANETQEQFDRLLKEYINNPNAITLYALETPIEEEIAYSADDASEAGLSWQDTTSPSPTIKSEVKGVEEIDVLKTGKNLFDIDGNVNTTVGNTQKAKNSVQNGILTSNYNSSIEALGGQLIKIENGKQYTISLNVISIGTGSGAYIAIYRNGEPIYSPNTKVGAWKTTITATVDEILLAFGTNNGTGAQFTNIQIEQGDAATAYEPYTEQRVNITLPQPLYSTVDGSICDYVDVEKGVEVYNMIKQILTTENVWTQYTADDNTRPFGKCYTTTLEFPFVNYEVMCDYLPYVQFAWKNATKPSISLSNYGGKIWVLCVVEYETLEEFTQWLSTNPMTIVFQAQTPTEIPIPQEDLKLLKSLKTEQGVTNIFVDGEVKPTIEARYALDIASIVSKLQTKLLTLQEEVVKNV